MRRLLPAVILVFIPILMPTFGLAASPVSPELQKKAWPARWVTYPGARSSFGVYHFRKSFELGQKPASFVVHVSADNRYELFVNGSLVSQGPARGDLYHWRFETVDLAPHLVAGRNVLAAVVWNFAQLAPQAQMSSRTGFLLQGNTAGESLVNTPSGWKTLPNRAYSPAPPEDNLQTYIVIGPEEKLDASVYPWGWETSDFDDSGWTEVETLAVAAPRGIRDSPSRWFLVQNTLPPMLYVETRLQRLARQTENVASSAFPAGSAPFSVPANKDVTILFDQGHLTTAYPVIRATGGRGAELELKYAEALRKLVEGRQRWEKGNRNDITGKIMRGVRDVFLLDGQPRTFRPLWWRTYRYLQLQIKTAGEPVTVHDLKGMYTAYPFKPVASFETPDPIHARMWDIGWRTAQLCAHETYMDCPYYEQLQYVGDTRIQALISLYLTADDRLVRNALEQIDASRIPEGLTQSRFPSELPQIIPPFSLFWINMLHDYFMLRDDPAFVRTLLPGTRGVINWFEARRDPASGILGPLEWWDFVDWPDAFDFGTPKGVDEGGSAIVSLQLAGALRDAAHMEDLLGDRELAARYQSRAAAIVNSVRETCWDPQRRFFADTPKKTSFTQHVNILAALEDVITGRERRELLRRVLADTSLIPATMYFRHYLARAMNKAGLGDLYLDNLGLWKDMIDLGLTTWAEKPDPVRSDCHAWSASPNYEFLATVAGVEPREPGFRSVLVRPHLGSLPWVKAKIAHPKGIIEVDLKKENANLAGTVILPEGVSGRFESGRKRLALRPGKNTI
ncbi:MAG: alpha-L-rhamnosidase C-terminal domain-containing protein [Acidobacteriota bacterium]